MTADTTSQQTHDTVHTTSMTDASTVEVDPVPALAVAQTPSFCRLCDLDLPGLQTWRAHVKSDAHVYKLRVKVAEPGSVTPPPPATNANHNKSPAPSKSRTRHDPNLDTIQTKDVDDNDEDEPAAPPFVPGSCLFCPQDSDDLDTNMTHMSTAHGFSVPFQDFLAVDLETVISYVHFVIFGYQECICCGTRRNTVEGAQQHMLAKGHCRFDISPDTEEFYEMPQSENFMTDQTQREVRLPSGRLIAHRKNIEPQEPRLARRPTPDQSSHSPGALPSRNAPTPGTEVARRGGNGSGEVMRSSEALLAAQLSRLRVADVRIQAKEEQRRRGRLESANNVIAGKHFRPDAGDGRLSRKFNC